jgi:hypothetical protein
MKKENMSKAKRTGKAGVIASGLRECTSMTQAGRVRRLCSAPGGAMVNWLLSEAAHREHDDHQLSAEVGITCGYLRQLQQGQRRVEEGSQAFYAACARYLDVPIIVVKIVSGSIAITDFSVRRVMDETISDGISALSREYEGSENTLGDIGGFGDIEKAMLLLTQRDAPYLAELLELRQSMELVRWLQKLVVIHTENELQSNDAFDTM